MIARFDHRPRLTAALALATTVLFVAVVTLSTLLITATPPTVAPTSDSGGAAAHAHAQAGLGPGSPATYNGAGLSAADARHAAMVEAYNDNR
jgi:hypothetical protein